ncbi:hypothetical protein [Phascolarctobacterium sp.]|uniref:hypothetical protein n=1 Tax=Phascolarctobacterium sp. TaxID=2049039 RepID=UPI00386AEE77
MIDVSIRDEITPLITEQMRKTPAFMRGLTKSIGWYVQKGVKTAITRNQISAGWEERIPLGIRRKLDEKAPRQWYGRLKQAIGYQYKDGVVEIGWTSSTSAMEGRIQEFGTQRNVTPVLRAYFAKHGVPLKESTTKLDVPARPVFEPAMDVVEPGIAGHVDSKVKQFMEKGSFGGKAKSSRKYVVFK